MLRKCNHCGLVAHTEADLELFIKNKSGKHGRENLCRSCNAKKGQKWYINNPERKAETNKQWYIENRERVIEVSKQWYAENKERVSETGKQWRTENKERKAETMKQWCTNNRDKRNSHNAKRRATKLQATPSWFDMEKKRIEFLYTTAQLKELHVDHIVPLQNDIVCGLHCLANLQLLTPSDNIAKSNSFAA